MKQDGCFNTLDSMLISDLEVIFVLPFIIQVASILWWKAFSVLMLPDFIPVLLFRRNSWWMASSISLSFIHRAGTSKHFTFLSGYISYNLLILSLCPFCPGSIPRIIFIDDDQQIYGVNSTPEPSPPPGGIRISKRSWRFWPTPTVSTKYTRNPHIHRVG